MAIELISDGDEITVADKDLPGITDGDPDVSYTLRKLAPEVHRKIVKQHTKRVFERNVGQVERTDALAATDDIIDHVLIGWSGVLLKGEPAPCVREWKLKGLDTDRKRALIEKAGMNEIVRAPERRAESFRSPA